MKSLFRILIFAVGVVANFWDNLASLRDAPHTYLPQNFSISVSTDSTLLNVTAEFAFQGSSDSAQLKVYSNILGEEENMLFALSAYNSSIYFQQQDKKCLVIPLDVHFLSQPSIGNLMALAPMLLAYKSYNNWRKQELLEFIREHTFILGNITNDYLISPNTSIEFIFDKDLNLKRIDALTGKKSLSLEVLGPLRNTQFSPSYFKITETCRIITEKEQQLLWERLLTFISKSSQIIDVFQLSL